MFIKMCISKHFPGLMKSHLWLQGLEICNTLDETSAQRGLRIMPTFTFSRIPINKRKKERWKQKITPWEKISP